MKLVNVLFFSISLLCAVGAQAQPAGTSSSQLRTLTVVQHPTDVLCTADGKKYSIGAVISVEKASFQCVQVLVDPIASRSVTATWVQVQLAK